METCAKCVCVAGYTNQLYELDLNSLQWTDLSNLDAFVPDPRAYHGFEALGINIYSFGGSSTAGEEQLSDS